jgi:murein DD-endopeptidase MepM/ murein hydrolase activator NlpD
MAEFPTVSASIRQQSSISNIRSSIGGISSSTSQVETTIGSIKSSLQNKTKTRDAIIKRTQFLKFRRDEQKIRGEKEAQIEASGVKSGVPIPGAKTIQSVGGSFLDRILKFIGWTALGWLVENYPTWEAMGRDFIIRVDKLRDALQRIPGQILSIYRSFGKVLTAYKDNLFSLDLFDSSKRVYEATEELGANWDALTQSFQDATGAFTEPTGVDIPSTDETVEETEQRISEGGTPQYTSEGGEKITDPEGADYGDYIPGAEGSRGKARVHGADGRTRGHTGEDYAMPIGTPLTLLMGGKVVDVETNVSKSGGYGKFVVVQLENGNYIKLAHLNSVNVRVGEEVGAGTGPNGTAKVLGFSGDTGLSSGPHLHLDYSTGYDPSNAAVSGTMNPASLINSGALVKGKDVKKVKTSQPAPPPPPTSQPQQTMMGQPTPKGGKLSMKQLVNLARQAGFTEENAIIAAAIAMGESGGKSDSHNTKYPDNSYGLWQINMLDEPGYMLGEERRKKFGLKSNKDLFDPLTNAKAAFAISGGSKFGAWSVFSQGIYKDYLPEARKAASSPQMTSAKASSQSSMDRSITPDRRGKTVVVDSGGGGGAPQMPQSSAGKSKDSGGREQNFLSMLNNFMKQKLMLDLSYL